MAKKRKKKARAKKAKRAAPKRKTTLRKAKRRARPAPEVHTGPGSGVFPMLSDLFGGMDKDEKK